MLLFYCVAITIAAHYGFGQVLQDIPTASDIRKAILWEAVGQTVVVVAVWVSKTSLACFLLRLISNNPKHRIAIIIPSAALGISVSLAIIFFWLDCRPIAFLWDRSIPGGYCLATGNYVSIVAGSISVFTDLWYAGFPWYLLWGMQMPPREKLLIQVSLSLGVV